MYSIAYISRASDDLNKTDIENLLVYSEIKNNINGVKGMLLYKDGNFLQVLEGAEQSIKKLYERICKDNRHSDIQEIFQTPINPPIFKEYNSKFNMISSSFELVSLKGFLRRQRQNGIQNEVSLKLESFLGRDWFA